MDENNKTPEKGKLLVSEPFLLDPNFKRSIILLSEHGDDGSIGFILNKQTDLKLNMVIEDFPDFDTPVFFGGPVQINTLQFIHRSGVIIDGGIRINDGLYWGGSFEILKILIENKQVAPKDFRFFIGYSGWSARQLDNEMKLNSWIVASAENEDIFSDEPDKLWREILKNMGKKFAILASFPENPSVN
ncbi:MAG: YqgE/AlgH family protein [Ignavibacteria bacterium]